MRWGDDPVWGPTATFIDLGGTWEILAPFGVPSTPLATDGSVRTLPQWVCDYVYRADQRVRATQLTVLLHRHGPTALRAAYALGGCAALDALAA